MAEARISLVKESTQVNLPCSYFPLTLVPGIVDEIQTTYGVNFNIQRVQPPGLFSITEVRTLLYEFCSQPMLEIKGIKDYVTSLRPIVIEFQWEANDDQGQFRQVQERVNWFLNNAYYLSESRQESFIHDSTNYLIDFRFNPATLTKTNTGVTHLLKKTPKPAVWSYSLPENIGFVSHSEKDSEAIEQMYRYGGDHIVLAGIKHTVNFESSAMLQIDLETGERVPLKRFPLASLESIHTLPNYTFTLQILGNAAREAKDELQSRVKTLLHNTEVTCKLPESFSLKQCEDVAAYMVNIARQYCIEVSAQPVQNKTICITLKGVRECVERVELLLKKQSLDFQQVLLSMSHYVFSSKLPKWWEPQSENLHLPKVKEGSEEFTEVLKRMKKTMPNVKIIQLERIQNRPLWDKYELEKRQMYDRNNGAVNELKLFHGTRQTDPRMVIRSVRGIDYRYSAQDKHLLWGTGTYYAVNASYSNHYSYSFSYSFGVFYKQMLLVRVLTGNSYAYGGRRNPNLRKPPPLSPNGPELYDTVNGISGDSLVYVVYDHDRAYPSYLITYHSEE